MKQRKNVQKLEYEQAFLMNLKSYIKRKGFQPFIKKKKCFKFFY
ncbi:unnamed protein product [Paramecium sonneborni]|uniref:Uncharacterized protein n=1 Tax=Paramecium sonneborni TaxID=65129 RepID=A0A8S1M8L1_9CILI|nr:unnamed protein product [Paramecium sonneborni]